MLTGTGFLFFAEGTEWGMGWMEIAGWLLERVRQDVPKEYPEEAQRYRRQLEYLQVPHDVLNAQRVQAAARGHVLHGVLFAPVPVPSLLEETLASLIGQTYPHWQLHIILDADEELKGFDSVDQRVTVERVRVARRQWEGHMFLISQGDRLAPEALFMLEAALQQGYDAVYADEDSLDALGERVRPVFKTGYSSLTLCSYNAVGRPFLFPAALFHPVQVPLVETAGEEYQLNLRIAPGAGRVGHVPRVLYTRGAPPGKPGMDDARRSVDEALAAAGGVGVAMPGTWRGSVRVAAPLFSQPKVSILTARPEDFKSLARMLLSIDERSLHPAHEVIIADEGERDEQLVQFYRQLQENGAARVHWCPPGTGLPALYNRAARAAGGDLLVFADPCLELRTCADWLEELMGQLYREQVGAAGGRLLYPGGHVAQAGYVPGLLGGYAPACLGLAPEAFNEAGQRLAGAIREVNALSHQLMAVKAGTFFAAGGFDETLDPEGFDLAFCLKLREKNLRCVYTPFAQLTLHREPRIPLESAPEDLRRRVLALIDKECMGGDRFYSPGFDHKITLPLPDPMPDCGWRMEGSRSC